MGLLGVIGLRGGAAVTNWGGGAAGFRSDRRAERRTGSSGQTVGRGTPAEFRPVSCNSV